MTETTNFGLKKPDANDFYDFETQNDNLDVIDEKLKECMEGGTAEKVTYENESVVGVTNVKEALDGIIGDYLPLSGGDTLGKGNYRTVLKLKGTTDALLAFLNSDNAILGYYGVSTSSEPLFLDNSNGTHTIFHTGNKPSGTYTGNGSATARTIATGGIGKALFVFNGNGFSIVTAVGATVFYRNGSSYKYISSDDSYWTPDSGLYLRTTDTVLNGSDKSTTYQVM